MKILKRKRVGIFFIRILVILPVLYASPVIADSQYEQKHQQNTQNSNFVDPVMLNGVSVPSDYPFISITENDNPDKGYIFFSTMLNDPHFNMILDNSGNPVWYHRYSDYRWDFKLQPDGRITMANLKNDQYIAIDSTYTVVETFIVPAGYIPDEHELQVLPNGHYFLIARRDSIIDMSQLIEGGYTKARVYGNSVVEMDANDKLVRMWSGWEHYNIFDAVHEDFTGQIIDYLHMNAIAVDLDGHILVSCRAMDEITKFNRQTGEVIWRLGGVNDYFTWPEGEDKICYQHDIRVLPNGNYTLFDNGNYRFPKYTRVLELSLDTNNWTVTKVWEYRNNPEIYSEYMGSAQRLTSGNTVICWSNWELPKLTEVRPDGSKAFEMDFIDPNLRSYRTFRFPWRGKAALPYLIAESNSSCVTLIFNKFGDTDVAEYRIYGGTSSGPNQVIAKTSQPFVHLFSELQSGTYYYFRVTAVNSFEKESGFSNEESVFVYIVPPGENIVINGNFSDGFQYWDWNKTGKTTANWEITTAGELHISIEKGGTIISNIQARHPNIQLVKGKTYVFEFDAYADAVRMVEFEIKKDRYPYTNCSQIGQTKLTTKQTHYSHEFVMEESSVFNAVIELNVGQSDHDVYVDNISVRELTSLVTDNGSKPYKYILTNNYPNPFNSQTTIQYHLPLKSHVCLNLFNILGKEVRTWEFNKDTGTYTFQIDADGLPSGVYFCQLLAWNENKISPFQATKKLLFIK